MARRKGSGSLRLVIETVVVIAIIVVVGIGVLVLAPRLVGPNPSTLNGTLFVGAVVAYPPATFWTVGTHAVKIENSSLSAQVNQTPIVTFRYGGGGDSTNQTIGVSYSNAGLASPPGPGDPQFVQFCEWRHCHAVMSVPGEIDDPGAAADTVAYVEQTLGFHPDFWSIGNEPQFWVHYHIPWLSWKTTDDSQVTPQEYAVLVHRYVAAMQSVDPAIRVIGIQSALSGTAGSVWMQPLVSMNGPNLSAVAYHSYPATFGSTGTSVSDFLAAGTTHGFPSDYRATEATVTTACPKCHLPVFVDEYNGALQGPFAPYVESYPDVPLVAAAVANGLQLNTSQFSFFDLQATSDLNVFGMLNESGTARPSFYLYSTFFENLSMRVIDSTSILGGPAGAAAVVGSNGTTVSLLVANANGSTGLRLNLTGSGFPMSGGASVWSWGPGEGLPQFSTLAPGALASTWLIPAEGILLIDVPL
ncbi:MAG: hypothetical protein L3K01_06345 [Thermoplasmata archaeon]|nr:hypothetical protein [Thermoplasmata archaeon]